MNLRSIINRVKFLIKDYIYGLISKDVNYIYDYNRFQTIMKKQGYIIGGLYEFQDYEIKQYLLDFPESKIFGDRDVMLKKIEERNRYVRN